MHSIGSLPCISLIFCARIALEGEFRGKTMRHLTLTVGSDRLSSSLRKGTATLSQGEIRPEDLEQFDLFLEADTLELLLWAPFVESQFVPVQDLSFWERSSLKRHLIQHHASPVIRPTPCLRFQPHDPKKLVLTSASLSELSQQVLNKAEQWKLPIKSIRLRTIATPQHILSKQEERTPWVGCLFLLDDSPFISLGFAEPHKKLHIFLTRPLPLPDKVSGDLPPSETRVLTQEIIQTVDYLTQRAGLSIDALTLFSPREIPPLATDLFPDSLRVTLRPYEEPRPATTSLALHMATPSTRKLHRGYLGERQLWAAAGLVGIFSVGAILKNGYNIHIQHSQQETLLRRLPQDSLATLSQKLSQQQELQNQLEFVEAKAQLSWTERHSGDIFLCLLNIAKQQGVLHSLTAQQIPPTLSGASAAAREEKAAPLSFRLQVTPRRFPSAAKISSSSKTSSLTQEQRRMVNSLKKALSQPSHPPFSLTSFVEPNKSLMTFDVSWGTKRKATQTPRLSRQQAPSISCLLERYGRNHVSKN